MALDKAFVPYGCYWSTPFCRWQGSFANLEPIPFAAEVAVRALKERNIPTEAFDGLALGWTVPSHHSFYGGPWVAAMIGMPSVPAPILSQAGR